MTASVLINNAGVTNLAYKYDPMGIRVEKTTNGQTIKYLVDHNLPYAQVLEERNAMGNLQASYVYGDDLIAQQRLAGTSYYHYDGLGSTRALTDPSTNITDTYNYEAFGTLLNQTGSTPNDYLFTGEQYDPNLGFYYLRARYYDHNIGRFATMDEWVGDNYDPISLHKYLYANVNPVNNIDPSGMTSISELGVVQFIQNLFNSISIKFTYVFATSSFILFRITNFCMQVLYRSINSLSRLSRLVNEAILEYPNLAKLTYDMKHHIVPKFILERMGLSWLINRVPLVFLNPAYHQYITNAIAQIVPMDGTPISLIKLPWILMRLLLVYIKFPLPPW